MLEPWNNSSFLFPPIHTLKSNSNDGKHLKSICYKIIRVLSKQSPLHQESAILSRFLYKYDQKFRNDIGYHNLKKVNTAIRKYFTLNLSKDIEVFMSALPTEDTDCYLPTKQMLQYILVRFLTCSKLMIRIYVCSKRAAIFYMDRLRKGQHHWMSLMPYALLSRVWSISKVLLQHLCSWYSCLYNFLDKLHLKGVEILPADYKLPDDIEKWLDIKNIDKYGRFQWSLKKETEIDVSIFEEDDDKFDSILNFVKQINNDEGIPAADEGEVCTKLSQSESVFAPLIKELDKGEVMSREGFQALINYPSVLPQISKMDNNHFVEKVTNKETLREFINREEKLRNEGNTQSLTTHLSFMQWLSLKSLLLKLYNSLSNNKKIEKKFQKIWKEKCLDYR